MLNLVLSHSHSLILVTGSSASYPAQRHIQRLCLGNRRMSAASVAAEVEGVGGQPVSAQTRCQHTASNWSAWLSSQKEASSKDDAQEARKQFAEYKQTKDMDYWNHILWSDETKINYLVQMVSSVCGGNQVRSTKTSMVVGVSWSGAA